MLGDKSEQKLYKLFMKGELPMNRKEYMNTLKEVLLGYNQEFAADVIKDYEDHFEISLKEGKTEDDICRELGDVNEAVEQLKQDFIDYKKQELIKISKQEKEDKKNDEKSKVDKKFVNEKACFESSKVKKLVLQLGFEDLFLEGIEGDEIIIECKGKNADKNFHCEQRGDTIYGESFRILDQFRVNFNFIFCFGLMFDKAAKVKVCIPNYLEEIEIHTASEKTFIGQIGCKKLSYTGASGDIEIKKCNIEKLAVKTINGDIEIEECSSTSLKAKSMSGEIDILDSKVKHCLMESMSGDVTMKHTIFDAVSGSSKSGDIKIVLTDDVTGVAVEVSTVSGDITAGHKGNKSSCERGTFQLVFGDGSCSIKASTILGDITIKD